MPDDIFDKIETEQKHNNPPSKPKSKGDIFDQVSIDTTAKPALTASFGRMMVANSKASAPAQSAPASRSSAKKNFSLYNPEGGFASQIRRVKVSADPADLKAGIDKTVAQFTNINDFLDVPLGGEVKRRAEDLLLHASTLPGYKSLPNAKKVQIQKRLQEIANTSSEGMSSTRPTTLREETQRIAMQQRQRQFEAEQKSMPAASNLKPGESGFGQIIGELHKSAQRADRQLADILRTKGHKGDDPDVLAGHRAMEKMSPEERLGSQDPRGPLFNIAPEFYAELAKKKNGPEGFMAGFTEAASGMANTENAQIMAALGPLSSLGKAGRIGKAATSAYFGTQGAEAFKQGVEEYRKSGDAKALGKAAFGAAVMAGALHHAAGEVGHLNPLNDAKLTPDLAGEHTLKQMFPSGEKPVSAPTPEPKTIATTLRPKPEGGTEFNKTQIVKQSTKPTGRIAKKTGQVKTEPTPSVESKTVAPPKKEAVPAPEKIAEQAKPATQNLEKHVQEAHTKLEGLDKPHAGTANAELSKLEKLGIDTSDARDALDEYKGIDRSDYDSTEDYQDARQEAWDNFIQTHGMIDASEVEIPKPESTKPEPAKPAPTAQEVKSNPDKFLYHVSGIKHKGPITSQPFGVEKSPVVWLSRGGPTARSGHVYAIDPSKVPGKIRDSRNGFPVHEGDIPENAYIYLGERSAHEPFDIKSDSSPEPKPAVVAPTKPVETAKAAEGVSEPPKPETSPAETRGETYKRLRDSGMSQVEAGRETDRIHGEASPAPKPNGEPPPNAPIVGGVPKVTGGSGAPAPKTGFRLPSITDLKGWVKEASRVLANHFGRNLTGLERISKEPTYHYVKAGDNTIRVQGPPDKSALRAARTAANAATHFQVAAARAIPAIRKALGGNEADAQSFWNHLAESRLRGSRQRFGDLRDELLSMSDEDPGTDKRTMGSMEEEREPSLFDPKVLKKYTDILAEIQGKRRDSFLIDAEEADTSAIDFTGKDKDPDKFDNNLASTAQTLASNGNMQTLRVFLANAFDDAYNSVGTMHEFASSNPAAKDFTEYSDRPEVVKARQIYRDELANPLTEAYKANKGEESDYLGPLETYFPLLPKRAEGSGYPSSTPHEPFSKVSNPNAHFTTGLSEAYDTTQEAFLASAEASMQKNRRGALINTLIDQGLAQVIPRGTSVGSIPKTIMVNGSQVPAKNVVYEGGFTIVKNGKTFRVRSSHILMPDFLTEELTPILQGENFTTNQIRAAMGKLTEAAIFGPTAAVYHAHNLLGSMVAATPFVGKGIAGKLPGIKLFKAISTVASIDPSAPERVGDIQTLARIGQIHPKTGGQHNLTSGFLYGLKGMDLRTRLALLDIARSMHEANGTTPSDEDLFDFISVAGTYTRGLDSGIERSLKGAGIAPFITAGKTQISTGLRALTGTSHIPTEGLPKSTQAKLRAQQLLSGGVVGYVGMWLAINGIYNGKLPGKGDKLGRIKIKDKDRKSPAGQMIFGAGTDDKYVSLAFFNPTMSRGMRDATIEAVVNGRLAGRSGDQIAESMEKDVLNGFASPVTTSPTVREPMIALTGKAPYATAMSEKFGKSRINKPTLIDAVGEREVGARRWGLQIKEALLNSNPYLEIFGQTTGIGHRREDRANHSAGRVLVESLMDLAFPRAFPMEMPKRTSSSSKDPLEKGRP